MSLEAVFLSRFFSLKLPQSLHFPENSRKLIAFFDSKSQTKNQVQNESVTAYVSIGSNLGDRAGNLLLAVRALLEANFQVCRLSAVYETEPVEVEENHGHYLNMVAELCVTNVTPEQMMARMIRIEYLLGRREKNLKKPRTVDLDLLFYGNLQYHTPFLTLPHPRLHARKFVLIPMAEIAPHFIHPAINQTIQEILDHLEDTSSARRWNPNKTLNASEKGKI